MNTKAIGLSGFAGSGKSAVATYLERAYGFRRRHIAEPLRAMLRPLFAAYGIDDATTAVYLEGKLKETVVPEFGKTPRQLQITLGTEWGRQKVSDTLWTGAWKHAVASSEDIAINDSVRFPNERDVIQDLGGFVIHIERPGVGPASFTKWWGRTLYRLTGLLWGAHPSERTDLVVAEYVVVNDGTLQKLYDEVDIVMQRAGFRRLSAAA
jgi:hypothetical protein